MAKAQSVLAEVSVTIRFLAPIPARIAFTHNESINLLREHFRHFDEATTAYLKDPGAPPPEVTVLPIGSKRRSTHRRKKEFTQQLELDLSMPWVEP